MSQFIPLKGLHFLKVINAIIAFSVQKSKQAPESYRGETWCFSGFAEAMFPVAQAE